MHTSTRRSVCLVLIAIVMVVAGFSVRDCAGGLPAGVVRHSHRWEPHHDGERLQLPHRPCKSERRPHCRSGLEQSPRSDSQRRGIDWWRRDMDPRQQRQCACRWSHTQSN